MKKIIQCILILMLMNNVCWGQDWYFGENGGIKFNTNGTVTALSGNTITTTEGCSLIHDKNGNILFYTDGSVVKGSNGATITGGTGLKGSASATQSALIIPMPNCDCKKYLVFTVPAVDAGGLGPGLNYSIIEMTTANPTGEITTINKNINLVSLSKTGDYNGYISEKLTATKDGNGGFWVMAHGLTEGSSTNGTSFYAYHITNNAGGSCFSPSTGLSSATVSKITSHDVGLNGSLGQIKFSPDGSKIAYANWGNKEVSVFDFNISTGVVSNPKKIIGFDAGPYGLSFSPNGNMLYVAETYTPANVVADIYRIDITNITSWAASALIANVGTSIDQRPVTTIAIYNYGSMEIGPDHKIYVANTKSGYAYNSLLGVIDNPDLSTSIYSHGAITTAGSSRLSLPSVIQGFSNCEDPCNKCHNVSTNYKNVSSVIRKDTTFRIGCNESINFGFNQQCFAPQIVGLLGVSVKDQTNNTPAWGSNFVGTGTLSFPNSQGTYTVTYFFGTLANANTPADTCDRIKITIVDTCSPPPCTCPLLPYVSYHLGSGFTRGIKVDCGTNKVINIKCQQQVNIFANANCQGDGCTQSGVNISVAGPGVNYATGEGDNLLAFFANQKGDYVVTTTSTCNGKTCTPCKVTFHVEECKCPPPPCCKTPMQITLKKEEIKFQYAAETRVTIPFQLNGNGKKFTQVRANVVGFDINSDNQKCFDCFNDSKLWGSVYNGTLNSFTPTYTGKNIGSNVNTREVVFNSTTPQTISTTNLDLRFFLPAAQTLSCCNVYADIYIKISYRDNECNECDTIIPVRVSLVKTKNGKPVDINLPDNPPPGSGRKAQGYIFSLK